MSLFDYMNRCTVFDYFQLKQKRPKPAVFQAKINISLHSNFVSHVYRVYELQMKQNNASSFFGQKQYKIPGKKYYLSIYLSAHLGNFTTTIFDSLGGSVGCTIRLETRRPRVQPPPRSATFFRGD